MKLRLMALVFLRLCVCVLCAAQLQVAETAVSAATASERKADRFDVQAHAGGKGWVFPGNILEAFEYALDLQVTTLELDMNYTKDGVIIVIHDRNIPLEWHIDPDATGALPPDPTTASEEELAIKNLTLEQIKHYRCELPAELKSFPGRSADTKLLASAGYGRIPTLEEVFQFCRDYATSEYKSEAQRENAKKVQFNIETKTRGFEQAVVDTVGKFDLVDRVMVQSFDHRSIATIAQINPRIRTSALDGFPDKVVEYTKATIWSPRYTRVTAENVRTAHDLGLFVIPWTVDEPADLTRLIDMGVDGIITNYPDRLQKIIEERGIPYAP